MATRTAPIFQRRHYEAIASAMRDAMPEAHWGPNKSAQWFVTIDRMMLAFEDDNPLFDRERFQTACTDPAKRRVAAT